MNASYLKWFPFSSTSEGTASAGSIGLPMVNTRWTPSPSRGVSCTARATSCGLVGVFIIQVVEVTTPRKWASRMPREISGVRP